MANITEMEPGMVFTELDMKYMASDEIETEDMASDELSCVICKKSFAQASNLKRHNQNIHGSGKVALALECMMCGKVLSRSDHLKRHMKMQHNK